MNTAAEVSSFGTEKLSKLMLKFFHSLRTLPAGERAVQYRRSDFYRQQRAEYARQRGHGRRFPVFHHRAGFLPGASATRCAAYLNICLGKKRHAERG